MIYSFPLLVLLLMTTSLTTSSDTREHKVHNIALYPERHSWCQTTAIKQIVAMPGYKPMTIDNNVCVGACYSYSIPRTQPAEPGELIGPYCDSCQPLETQCYHVTLKSDGQTPENNPKTIQKRVQIITNCSCSSCTKVQTSDCEISDQSTSELPTNLFSLLHPNHTKHRSDPEVPELLNLSPPHKNRTLPQPLNENATNEQRYEINAKLIALLKSIQNQEDDDDSNLNYDKKQLKELLDIIEGSEHQLSDKNLMDFVNFVNVHNSEDLELDLSRLKEVLTSFRDDEDLGKKYSISKISGVEGSRLGMGHLKGSHIGMGIHHHIETNLVGKDENKVGHHKGKFEDNGGSVKTGHHHLGETQHIGVQVGHLTHGPHNSLVLVPDKVEETLNLDSEEVRPNHEGVVISYENHHRSHHRHKQPTN